MILIIIGVMVLVCNTATAQPLPVSSCDDESTGTDFSKAGTITPLLEKLTETGIPGVTIAVYSDERIVRSNNRCIL